MRYDCFAPHITAFSTERGEGVIADAPYDGFNINPYCGDAEEHVRACREKLCNALNITDERLILPHQVHDIRVADIDRGDSLEGADALMTAQTGICIGVSTADCLPILLHDRRNDVICAVHSGWRGTVRRITAAALEATERVHGTRREDVTAAIGPGIRLEAFEVGDEVYEAFLEAGFDMETIARKINSRWHIDLAAAVKSDLAGTTVHDCGICTFTHHSRFFSARRLGINSGRIYSGIIINDSNG